MLGEDGYANFDRTRVRKLTADELPARTRTCSAPPDLARIDQPGAEPRSASDVPSTMSPDWSHS